MGISKKDFRWGFQRENFDGDLKEGFLTGTSKKDF